MKIREAIIKLNNLEEQYINMDNNTYILSDDNGVIIAFNADDALSIVNGLKLKNSLTYNIDINNFIFEDEMNQSFSYRLAGVIQLAESSIEEILETGVMPSIYRLKELANSKPIMLKIAQWGGQGGQGVNGIGQGLGAGNPMAGGVNFDNPIVRVQFDKSLDLGRKNGQQNGWYQTLETRMQENPLYGHQRNDKDWNLKNYRMTYKERMQEKKKEFLKRMFANRERFDKLVDEHSVANIKAAPIDPKYYISIEERLKGKRQQEDSEEKRKNIHGPESQFTYFPPTPKRVTAQTITHNGLSSVFDDDPETISGNKAYPDFISGKARIREHPWGLYGPTRDGQMLDINNNQNPSTQPVDLNADNNLLWGGAWNNAVSNNSGGKIGLDYLMDANATGNNPGEIQEPIFTADMLPGVIQELRDHLKIQDDINKPKQDNDQLPIEQRLKSQHKAPSTIGINPTNYDIQRVDDPYPYASKEFFGPRMRLDHAGG